MADRLKRCRSKLPPSKATLKSPDPKKLKKAAKLLQSPASASTATPESILKKKREPELARQLSFGSVKTTSIRAENEAPKSESSCEAGVLRLPRKSTYNRGLSLPGRKEGKEAETNDSPHRGLMRSKFPPC